MSSLTLARAYDPKACKLIIAGKTVTGYNDGTKISIEKSEDDNFRKVGADGEYSDGINRNKTGVLTFTLQQTAKSMLTYITNLRAAQRATRILEFPIAFTDPTGMSLPLVCTGVIRKIGTYSAAGAEISGVEITIALSDAEMVGQESTGVLSTAIDFISSIV